MPRRRRERQSFCSGYQRSIILEKCRNIALGTNTIDFNPDYAGERIDGVTISDSAACTLDGLIVQSARSGSAESGGAIHIARSSEMTITGCQVLDPVHRGLHLEAVRNSIISGCTVLVREPSPTLREAILAQQCGPDVLIQGNLLGKGARGDLVVEMAPDCRRQPDQRVTLRPVQRHRGQDFQRSPRSRR